MTYMFYFVRMLHFVSTYNGVKNHSKHVKAGMMRNKTPYFLGPNEDKEDERSRDESEGIEDEEDYEAGKPENLLKTCFVHISSTKVNV